MADNDNAQVNDAGLVSIGGNGTNTSEEVNGLKQIMSHVTHTQRVMAAAMDSYGVDPMSVSGDAATAYQKAKNLLYRAQDGENVDLSQVRAVAAELNQAHINSMESFNQSMPSSYSPTEEFTEDIGARVLGNDFSNTRSAWDIPTSGSISVQDSDRYSSTSINEARAVIQAGADLSNSPTSPLGGHTRRTHNRNIENNRLSEAWSDGNGDGDTSPNPAVSGSGNPVPANKTGEGWFFLGEGDDRFGPFTTKQEAQNAASSKLEQGEQIIAFYKDNQGQTVTYDRSGVAGSVAFSQPSNSPRPPASSPAGSMIQDSINDALAKHEVQETEKQRDANRASITQKPKVAVAPYRSTTAPVPANKTGEGWFFLGEGDDRFGPFTTKQEAQNAASSKLEQGEQIIAFYKDNQGQTVTYDRSGVAGSVAFSQPSNSPRPPASSPAGSMIQDSINDALAKHEVQETEKQRDANRASITQKPKVAVAPYRSTTAPVPANKTGEGWFFLGEGDDRFGPFTTKQEAQNAASSKLEQGEQIIAFYKDNQGQTVTYDRSGVAGSVAFSQPSNSPRPPASSPAGSMIQDSINDALAKHEVQETEKQRDANRASITQKPKVAVAPYRSTTAPVPANKTGEGWFFLGEGDDRFGPFTTKQEAQNAASSKLEQGEQIIAFYKDNQGQTVTYDRSGVAGSVAFSQPSNSPRPPASSPAGSMIQDSINDALAKHEVQETEKQRDANRASITQKPKVAVAPYRSTTAPVAVNAKYDNVSGPASTSPFAPNQGPGSNSMSSPAPKAKLPFAPNQGPGSNSMSSPAPKAKLPFAPNQGPGSNSMSSPAPKAKLPFAPNQGPGSNSMSSPAPKPKPAPVSNIAKINAQYETAPKPVAPAPVKTQEQKNLDTIAAIYARGDAEKIKNWENFVAAHMKNTSTVKPKATTIPPPVNTGSRAPTPSAIPTPKPRSSGGGGMGIRYM